MPDVFKTMPDDPHDTEIGGAGTMFAQAKGGVVVDSASLVMQELQEHETDGSVKLDPGTGAPIPLTGAALASAAQAWVDARGFQKVTLTDAQVAGLAEEGGAIGDEPPEPAADASAAYYENTYAHLVHMNTPDQMSGLPPEVIPPPGPPILGAEKSSPSKATKASGEEAGS